VAARQVLAVRIGEVRRNVEHELVHPALAGSAFRVDGGRSCGEVGIWRIV
jgi:hypothetical protein